MGGIRQLPSVMATHQAELEDSDTTGLLATARVSVIRNKGVVSALVGVTLLLVIVCLLLSSQTKQHWDTTPTTVSLSSTTVSSTTVSSSTVSPGSTAIPDPDPQCLHLYSRLEDTWREERHGDGGRGVHCDSVRSGRYYTGFHSGWYRFMFPNNPYATIPTSAPHTHHQEAYTVCGTRGSSWTNSTLPELGDRVRNITIYFAWRGNNWNHPQTGQVVACRDRSGQVFMVYYLPKPTGGCDGYCAA